MTAPWLVVIDMQEAFSHPSSGWYCEGYGTIVSTVSKLVDEYAGRVVFTRFVRDVAENGHWEDYYNYWAEFRVAPDDSIWRMACSTPDDAPVVDEPTFSKWTTALREVVGPAPLVMCGVATECCVLATALAAANSGWQVRVVSDACAGATQELHQQALAIMSTAMAPMLSVCRQQDITL